MWSLSNTRPGRRSRSGPGLQGLEARLAPATITVTTLSDVVSAGDGRISLREAIATANATPAPDTITLKAGVYKIAIPGGAEDGNASGDFDITGPLTINGDGATATVVDGARMDRVFHIRGSGPSSFPTLFQGLTIRNGLSNLLTGTSTPDGGGILVSHADLKLVDITVAGNTAADRGGGISNGPHGGTGTVTLLRSRVSRNVAGADGGGIYLEGSTIKLTDSTVTRNFAGVTGGGLFAAVTTLKFSVVSLNLAGFTAGGIYAGQTATLDHSTVRGNVASRDAFGGGVYTTTAVLTNSLVSGNTAGYGAGVSASTASLTSSRVVGNSAAFSGGGIHSSTRVDLNASLVSGNRAATDGGGIYCPGTATLTHSTVNDNEAGTSGGGIAATTAHLTNCTVDGNVSRGFGGGITAPATTLTNCTVSNNFAVTPGGGINAATVILSNTTVSGNTCNGDGGGIFASYGTISNSTIVENFSGAEGGGVSWASETDPIRVKNTIIALNLAPRSSKPDVDGVFVSLGHNLIGDAGGSSGFGAAGDQSGNLLAPLDPRLGPLENNGGRTLTHALRTDSPAIDRGNSVGSPAYDQRGIARPRDGDLNGSRIVDIGAYER